MKLETEVTLETETEMERVVDVVVSVLVDKKVLVVGRTVVSVFVKVWVVLSV